MRNRQFRHTERRRSKKHQEWIAETRKQAKNRKPILPPLTFPQKSATFFLPKKLIKPAEINAIEEFYPDWLPFEHKASAIISHATYRKSNNFMVFFMLMLLMQMVSGKKFLDSYVEDPERSAYPSPPYDATPPSDGITGIAHRYYKKIAGKQQDSLIKDIPILAHPRLESYLNQLTSSAPKKEKKLLRKHVKAFINNTIRTLKAESRDAGLPTPLMQKFIQTGTPLFVLPPQDIHQYCVPGAAACYKLKEKIIYVVLRNYRPEFVKRILRNEISGAFISQALDWLYATYPAEDVANVLSQFASNLKTATKDFESRLSRFSTYYQDQSAIVNKEEKQAFDKLIQLLWRLDYKPQEMWFDYHLEESELKKLETSQAALQSYFMQLFTKHPELRQLYVEGELNVRLSLFSPANVPLSLQRGSSKEFSFVSSYAGNPVERFIKNWQTILTINLRLYPYPTDSFGRNFELATFMEEDREAMYYLAPEWVKCMTEFYNKIYSLQPTVPLSWILLLLTSILAASAGFAYMRQDPPQNPPRPPPH